MFVFITTTKKFLTPEMMMEQKNSFFISMWLHWLRDLLFFFVKKWKKNFHFLHNLSFSSIFNMFCSYANNSFSVIIKRSTPVSLLCFIFFLLLNFGICIDHKLTDLTTATATIDRWLIHPFVVVVDGFEKKNPEKKTKKNLQEKFFLI